MRVVGITKGTTTFGKELRNGGSALLVDGEIICALGEERVTGIKHAPGYERSLKALLATDTLDLADIDRIAVSTCCEPTSHALLGHPLSDDPRLMAVGHHLSHAAFAFHASGFDRALIAVMDGGGNVLAEEPDRQWWGQPREQHSYYLADRSGIRLVDRDLSGPFDVGFGELYRAFTYFLGWHSSRHASRLMTLAAHSREGLKGEIFDFTDDHLSIPLNNDPRDPIGMVLALGEELGIDFGEPRSPGEEILQIHADVAAFVQRQLEIALIRKLSALRLQYRFDHLCLSGGVALNVVANGRLVEERFVEEIYVPPAPADDGQCVGNAIVATMSSVHRGRSMPLATSAKAALGPQPRVDSAAVSDALHRTANRSFTIFENPQIPATVARFLDMGLAVIVFQGRSEFGPRALGQRSILADPRKLSLRSLINQVKQREWFMPFAPAVLAERAYEWFEHDVPSPFMSFAARVRPDKRDEIPAVVSEDGTARLQTLMPGEDSLIRQIVLEFERLTGIPLVLNTSFNHGGHPIVETVEQAIETFGGMAVNAMVLGRFIVVKKLFPGLATIGVLTPPQPIEMAVVQNGKWIALESKGRSARQIIRKVQELTGAVVFIRHDFPLYGPYLAWLREGRKVTTIRFRKRGVEIPTQDVLPLYETRDYGVGKRDRPAASVRVLSIRYQRFGELTERDAKLDGFKSLSEMLTAFREIYPNLGARDWVTIYGIRLE
jgi:carbamoyltransferase